MIRPMKPVRDLRATGLPCPFPAFLGILLAVLTPLLAGAANPPALTLKVVAEGFTSPIILTPLPDGSGRLVVVDQIGMAHLLNRDAKISEKLFFDARDRLVKLNQGFDERGWLGLAFHPQFKQNRRLFIHYSAPRREGAPKGWDHTGRVSEFKARADNFAEVDPASERVVLEIDQPQANHNGGAVLFGPDGYLYIALGDGGGGNDSGLGHREGGNGQDTTTLLGKILRIDVDHGKPYGIPQDNPFADGRQGRPEIFSYGHRNPWGVAFDRGGTQELFEGEVGQNAFEEVNLIVKGGNYGWRVREGFHPFSPENPNVTPEAGPTTGADGKPFVDPIIEYRNFKAYPHHPEARGTSVTGGRVYRGRALPHLVGRYVFADWARNWALPQGTMLVATRPAESGKPWTLETLPLADSPEGWVKGHVVGIGEDEEGELYVLTSGRNTLTGQTGKIHKLVAQ